MFFQIPHCTRTKVLRFSLISQGAHCRVHLESQKPPLWDQSTATASVGDGFSESLKPSLQQGQRDTAYTMPPGQLWVLSASQSKEGTTGCIQHGPRRRLQGRKQGSRMARQPLCQHSQHQLLKLRSRGLASEAESPLVRRPLLLHKTRVYAPSNRQNSN